MDNNELRALLFVAFITAFVTLVPSDFFLFGRLFVIGVVGVGCLVYWIISNEKKVASTTSFVLSTLHYPFPYVTNENYNTLTPDYITNNRTMQAYRLSNETMQRCVRDKGVESYLPYANSKKLRILLENKGYVINEREAKFTDLDMLTRNDGSLFLVPNPISEELMAKLIERRNAGAFKHYELVFIHHWHHLSRSSQAAHFPTDRRLLVDFHKRTARPPPIGDLWMENRGIFNTSEHHKRVPCYLGTWVFLHYLGEYFPHTIHFKSKHYDVAELLTE
jgi:hypothetical protein